MTIERIKNLFAGMSVISMFVSILIIGGCIDGGGSVMAIIVSLLITFGLFCLLFYTMAYEEWMAAEENRIRNYINRYGYHRDIRSGVCRRA